MTIPNAFGAVVRFPSGVERLLLASIRDTAQRSADAVKGFNTTRAGKPPVELLRVVPVVAREYNSSTTA